MHILDGAPLSTEQCTEQNASQYEDFKKVFNSIDRASIWNLMQHYGIPQKIINITKKLHENFTCQVIHGDNLTEPFKVETGVRQGCLLSPLIFLIVLDWVTSMAYSTKPRGFQ